MVKRKQRPWLDQFNRREQAKTNTQIDIKGICIGGWKRYQLSTTHEHAALYVAFSAQGCSSKKSCIKNGEKWCQEGCYHSDTLVPLPSSLPPSLCPSPYIFEACIPTLKMREQKGCFLFTLMLGVQIVLLCMSQGTGSCHWGCHRVNDTDRERGCTCPPWAGGQHEQHCQRGPCASPCSLSWPSPAWPGPRWHREILVP